MYELTIISDESIKNKVPFNKDMFDTERKCYFLTGEVMSGNLHELSEIMLNFGIVPGICETVENKVYRSKECFQKSHFLSYDFDNKKGETVYPRDIITLLENENLNYIIAASQNHNKPKKDEGVKPRFHVFIPLKREIVSSETYSELWMMFKEKTGFRDEDKGAKDCCRFFAKHSEILKVQMFNEDLDTTGLMRELYVKKQQEKFKSKAKERLRELQHPFFENEGSFKTQLFIETHIELLNGLSTEGERHNSVCSLCGKVKRMGGTEEHVINLFQEYYSGKDPEKHLKTIQKLFSK